MSILDWWRKQPKPPARETPEPRTRGGSGRGHSHGFLELEELNEELQHPQSHTVFDRMYRTDADVRQVMQLCINPILAGTWGVQPFGGQEASEEDQFIAEAAEWALFEYMRPNLIGHLAQFLPIVFRSGFGPGEIVWGKCEYVPQARPAEHEPGEGAEGNGESDAKPKPKQLADERPGAKSSRPSPSGGHGEGEDTFTRPEKMTLLAPRTIEVRLPRSVWKWDQRYGQLTAIHQQLFTGMAPEEGGARGSGGGGGADLTGSVRLPARDLVYYRVGAEGDNWEGVSLLRPAYKHWYIKDSIERIDAVAQEREAIGVPICYPPAGASKTQLDDMESILQNLQTNEQGYIIMPGQKAGVSGTPDSTGWLLELIGFDRTGSGRDPGPSLEYHTNKIAAAFIAEFMRLGHGESGARATAQVQADPFQMAVEALVTTIVETELNDKIIAPFVAYNFPNAKNPPKLKMSLVDSTSLSQLADFVLKLTQVGALLPDQELEEFLRARADMPPPNPESVRRRGEQEEMIRRMIVGGNINPTPADEQAAQQAQEQADLDREAGIVGGNAKVTGKPATPPKRTSNNADPYGSNAKVGKHKNGKPSGAPSGAGGKGQGAPRGPAKNLSAAYADEPYGHHSVSRWYELHMDLDELDGFMSEMPQLMEHYCSGSAIALAQEMAGSDTPLGETSGGSGARQALRDELRDCLNHAYDCGGSTVHDELEAQGHAPGARSLDRGARDRGAAHLADRARLAADAVELSMRQAMVGHDLAHGQLGRAAAAAEKAGVAALRRVGHDHGVAAFLHGRHDTAHTLAEGGAPVKVIYSAALDHGTCDECAEADDGVARELSDPVRMERMPPNPHCESTHSGHNRCRCIESYVIEPDEAVQLSAPMEVGELHPYLQRIVTLLIGRGMAPARALTVAVRVARQVAVDGRVRWPGLRQVGAGDTEGARSAIQWIDARRTAG